MAITSLSGATAQGVLVSDGEEQQALDGVLCAEALGFSTNYSIICPGVVDLSCERYVKIICPTIEAHLYRDRSAEKNTPGMGVVQLGSGADGFLWSSFPTRRITTPIGRLGSFLVKLQLSNGTLFDTKGLDHLFTFVIRYYTVKNTSNASDMPLCIGLWHHITKTSSHQGFKCHY